MAIGLEHCIANMVGSCASGRWEQLYLAAIGCYWLLLARFLLQSTRLLCPPLLTTCRCLSRSESSQVSGLGDLGWAGQGG